MGVIKRSKFQHVSPLDNPLDVPDPNEPLQPLNGEEEDLVPINQQQSPPQAVLTNANRLNFLSTPITPSRYRYGRKSGKAEEKYPKGQKKQRRYENNKFLLNLTKSENDNQTSISGPGYTESRSVFATLLQQSDKMAAWNAFLAFCEDDQQAIIENDEMMAYFNNEPVLMEQAPSVVVKKIAEVRNARRAMTADQAFRTLCPKLKALFSKRHFPMGILVQLENEVVDFFLETPKGTCVIERSCSFDRCILHAIVQFNYLFSQSFSTEDNRRETHIRNVCPDFLPPPISLSQYIGKKRSR